MRGTEDLIAQDVSGTPGGMLSSTDSGGYAVVSVGLGNEKRRGPGRKYEILKDILPRGLADRLLVDVRDYLQAPPWVQRPGSMTLRPSRWLAEA